MSSAISASADAFVEAVCPELGTLLENEYFLLKVLEHVIEDGLHECRRVCRKWYDVCRRLPVKLQIDEMDKLGLACEMFPNATTVFTGAIFGDYCELIDRLGSLRHLRDLDVKLRGRHDSFALNLFPRSFEKLESLSLNLSSRVSSVDLGSSLQFLTNLTRLELIVPFNIRLQMEPVTQLRKLKNLCLVDAQKMTAEGQFLLQPLTGLTSLCLRLYQQSIQVKELISKVRASATSFALFTEFM